MKLSLHQDSLKTNSFSGDIELYRKIHGKRPVHLNVISPHSFYYEMKYLTHISETTELISHGH